MCVATTTATTAAALHSDFAQEPWVMALLASPDTTLVASQARTPKASTEDSFFAQTLNTRDTVRSFAVLRTPTHTLMLLALGCGVNGHAGIAHGGAVVAMLDEALGAAIGEPAFTVSLNTRFRRPVRTPAVVLCRARVTKSDGRKSWAAATMEDGAGTVLADADALFINANATSRL